MKALKSVFSAMCALLLAFSLTAGLSSCAGDDDDDEGSSYSSVTLTFYGNGGTTYSGESYRTVPTYSDTPYYFSNASSYFSYTGYTLLGWSKTRKTASSDLSVSDCDYKAGDSVTFTSDITLYAVWKSASSAKITLNFYANGGKYNGTSSLTGLTPDATATVTEGEYYSFTETSAKFTRTGYTLLGWANTKTATEAKVAYNGSSVFSSENGSTISLYAVWKLNETEEEAAKVTVKLYGNGGLCNGSTTSSLFAAATFEAEVGKAYSMASESAKFTRTGYTLLGWSTTQKTPSSTLTSSDCDVTASGTTTFSVTDGSTISLYAVWKIDSSSSGSGSSGTLKDDTISVPASKYLSTSFSLNKTATITVSMSCDNVMYYYLVDAENFELFKNGGSFKYYSTVSGEKVKSVSGSVTLAAGSYYYICENKNVISAKDVTRKITYVAN